jgi:predicted cupin superfamily sugar epimerase
MPTAQEIIKKLNLTPHVEKGFYIEKFNDASSSAIYYLLEKGDGQSNWHRVHNAVEVWHHYAGAPIRLCLSWNDGTPVRTKILGDDIMDDQEPQVIVHQNEWQSAESLGDWSLVGCTVAPAFEFEKFEMKEPGWQPKGA